MNHDEQTLNSVKRLAKKEYANYAGGNYLPEDRPCHVVNPAYVAISDLKSTIPCQLSCVTSTMTPRSSSWWIAIESAEQR